MNLYPLTPSASSARSSPHICSVLVREESDGAADEDQGVDAHAEAAGVGGLGCAAGRGRGGGGLRGGVACLFFRARVWVSEDWD
ncbi:hypothetical protein KC340_g72 [Hortaea werneckii]|nr:hypothetical protein KC340_g72 [Hortaea werneckii]